MGIEHTSIENHDFSQVILLTNDTPALTKYLHRGICMHNLDPKPGENCGALFCIHLGRCRYRSIVTMISISR